MLEFLFEMFTVILVLGAVIFLSYIVTRYIGEKAKNAMKGRYISIVETLSLGVDKRIHLVKVGEQYILIASSGKNIQFLTKVDLDNIENQETEEASNAFNFRSVLEKYAQNLMAKKNQPQEKEAHTENTQDKNVFKSNLARIKALTDKIAPKDNSDGDEKTNEK